MELFCVATKGNLGLSGKHTNPVGARVRVIAGTLRGRRLRVPPADVRPTADRVREAIFARLGDLSDARVLDLYAGTGALGIEALSRGAAHAIFVDRAPRSLAVLSENLAQLGLESRSRVLRSEALPAVSRLRRECVRVDLVTMDPPYASSEVDEALCLVSTSGILASGAVVVVETPKRHSLESIRGLRLEDEHSYGDTRISQFRAAPAENGPLEVEEPIDE